MINLISEGINGKPLMIDSNRWDYSSFENHLCAVELVTLHTFLLEFIERIFTSLCFFLVLYLKFCNAQTVHTAIMMF